MDTIESLKKEIENLRRDMDARFAKQVQPKLKGIGTPSGREYEIVVDDTTPASPTVIAKRG